MKEKSSVNDEDVKDNNGNKEQKIIVGSLLRLSYCFLIVLLFLYIFLFQPDNATPDVN